MLLDIRRHTSPAGKILQLLQRQGTWSIQDFVAALGVTSTAVRQQLTALLAAGLVTAATVRQRRGRPRVVYSLSAKAQTLRSPGYADLALVLLQEVLELPEPTRAQWRLQRVGARLGRQYAAQMRSTALADRLRELRAWLEERGIASKVDEEAESSCLPLMGAPTMGWHASTVRSVKWTSQPWHWP